MSNPVAQACSFLFVPATHPERFQKALASGADMAIADWEDAVAPADKADARAALLQAAAAMDAAQRARLLVRINAEGTPWFEGDLHALASLVDQGCAGAVVPKAERADTDPKVFTSIHFHYRVTGKNLKPEAVARAIELSKEKYCSASIMLAKTAEITCDYEIIEG